jgi:FAD/FMN-containing dehydrogenase
MWTPVWRVDRADAGVWAPGCVAPSRFPGGIELYRQAYQNWAQQITVDGLWTCAPRTPDDVVEIANWAVGSGYLVRARGMMHGWSPLVVAPGDGCVDGILLVDTTRHLTGVSLVSSSPPVVRVGAGATMNELLAFLEQHGLGVTACPAPGDITVAGALAIDGHGTAIRADGEEPVPGHTYGSLSNLIVSLTAVVWNARTSEYALRRFERSEREIDALLVHLGRAFITEVELRVGANCNLRCQSFVDIPASELFAAPDSAGAATQTLASFMEQSGRVEAIWYPFTDNPWLKVWTVSPNRPSGGRAVASPYNYPFTDVIPVAVSELATLVINGVPALTPVLGQAQYEVTAAGLVATDSADIWGRSKDLLLYIRPTTLRVTANGYAVLCRRADVQRAVSEFAAQYQSLVRAYRANGSYPASMPLEIRVTGLDDPTDVQIDGASSPVLSALHPRSDRPDWDVAVWFDVLTFANAPDSVSWYRQLEQWMYANYGPYASVRPEWSKGWAYSPTAAWSDPTILGTTIPATNTTARAPDDDWASALETLDRLDPHRIFTNTFLDVLMPPTSEAFARQA